MFLNGYWHNSTILFLASCCVLLYRQSHCQFADTQKMSVVPQTDNKNLRGIDKVLEIAVIAIEIFIRWLSNTLAITFRDKKPVLEVLWTGESWLPGGSDSESLTQLWPFQSNVWYYSVSGFKLIWDRNGQPSENVISYVTVLLVELVTLSIAVSKS